MNSTALLGDRNGKQPVPAQPRPAPDGIKPNRPDDNDHESDDESPLTQGKRHNPTRLLLHEGPDLLHHRHWTGGRHHPRMDQLLQKPSARLAPNLL